MRGSWLSINKQQQGHAARAERARQYRRTAMSSAVEQRSDGGREGTQQQQQGEHGGETVESALQGKAAHAAAAGHAADVMKGATETSGRS